MDTIVNFWTPTLKMPSLAAYPVSTSTRLTHSLSVCGTQPILGAMDSITAQSDGYSPRCSCTIRTARSRTSGENLFDFFMAQSSQRFEPPEKPGRFTQTVLAMNKGPLTQVSDCPCPPFFADAKMFLNNTSCLKRLCTHTTANKTIPIQSSGPGNRHIGPTCRVLRR